ncbi:hypothetical protein [Mycoplasmopsis bovirhinis]|uniref:hypothetical protein n=1 Tax=Mycoplasmopsis bovirhinis TaxID=29553 RepID=UPI0011AE8B56|nr:hypothetical protein [Mycoplasmopsis bovirhinis]
MKFINSRFLYYAIEWLDMATLVRKQVILQNKTMKIEINDELFQKLIKRSNTLSLSRSQYIRLLIKQDLEK